jgi:hypothetical protein
MKYICSMLSSVVFSLIFSFISMTLVVGYPPSHSNLIFMLLIGFSTGLIIFVVTAFAIGLELFSKFPIILVLNFALAALGAVIAYLYCSTISSV